VKHCVQCQNDLPDSAVHCVYCGAKQPVAAAVAAAGARTVMGYPGMAGDMARQGGAPPAAGPAGKGRPGNVSGFEATQPLSNDRFREGPPPGRDPGMNYGGAPAGFGGPAPAARGHAPQPGYGPPPGPMGPQQPGPQRHAPHEPQHGFGPPDQGFGPGPRPGSQPQQPPQAWGPPPHQQGNRGYGPPDQGFGPGPQGFGPPPDPRFDPGPQAPRPGSQPQNPAWGPPPQHQGYGPPDQGYGPQHGFGPPPSGSGFSPVHGPGPIGPQHHAYGAPPPMGFNHRPETELVAPLRPPYLASESARRMSSPAEPWNESLKTLMLVFGVLLVACFVAPWAVQPGETTFAWTWLSGELPISIKMVPILFLATGLLSVLLGALPLAALMRGFFAAGIGLAPIIYQTLVPAFNWRELIGLVGGVVLISGLLVRSQYTDALIGRTLATVGAVLVLLPLLIPIGEAVPLVELFKLVGAGSAQAAVAGIVGLVPVVLAVLAFLVWLPPPGRAGAHILAWTLIMWPLVAAIVTWLLGENLGDALKANLSGILYAPLAAMAWTALTGYGTATVIGKQLEHH